MHGPPQLETHGIEPVNWIGLWTLYLRKVRRFLRVSAQTVTGPAVTGLLFLLVFDIALGLWSIWFGLFVTPQPS